MDYCSNCYEEITPIAAKAFDGYCRQCHEVNNASKEEAFEMGIDVAIDAVDMSNICGHLQTPGKCFTCPNKSVCIDEGKIDAAIYDI